MHSLINRHHCNMKHAQSGLCSSALPTAIVLMQTTAKMNYPLSVLVRWENGHVVYYQVPIRSGQTVQDLRREIFQYTRIEPSEQVLYLNSKEIPNDNTPLAQLNISNDSIVHLATTALNPSGVTVPEAAVASEPGTSKQTLKTGTPRKNKCLVVLDIDGTIYDEDGLDRSGSIRRAQRPYLQELLRSLYDDYDIIFWSATNRSHILRKLNLLNISHNPDCNILCCLDRSDMVPIAVPDGSKKEYVKSLEVVWKKYPEYNKKNTIICDDAAANIHLNKKNGVLVTPYSFINFNNDQELKLLAKYLKRIASSPDLSAIEHANWKSLAK